MANTLRTKRIEDVWMQVREIEKYVDDMSRMVSRKAAIHSAAVRFNLSPAVVASHCGMVEGLDKYVLSERRG